MRVRRPNRADQPAGARSKVFFRTVRDQFLVEIAAGPDGAGSAVGTLAELNSLFTAWVEQVVRHEVPHVRVGVKGLHRPAVVAAG